MTALVAGGLAVALILVGWVVYSRATFGTWNPLDEPARITYCQITFVPPEPGTYLTRAQVDAYSGATEANPLQLVGTTGSGAGIYAKLLSDSLHTHGPGGASCPDATYLYLKVGADKYRWYIPSAIAL